MSRTYQVSRTICCGRAPGFRQNGRDIGERLLHLRDELGETARLVRRRSSRRRTPVRPALKCRSRYPFGCGQPGGCKVRWRALRFRALYSRSVIANTSYPF